MATPAVRALPALQPGDRLTREEFERRYDAMPEATKAELIEGIVYMTFAVRIDFHAEPHSIMVLWAGTYAVGHPDLQTGDNGTLRLDNDNEVQPDALLRRREGGTSRVSADNYVEGPPELVIEISASTVSIDLHTKKDVYRRSGVGEYIVWRVADGAIDWFDLVRGQYELRAPDADGIVESRQFPGLRLDVPALLRGDLAAVLAAVR
jgi:Uma2 family endonuclease